MYQSLQQQSLLPLNMKINQTQKYPEFSSLFQKATSAYQPTSWNTTQGTETTTQTNPSSFYTDPAYADTVKELKTELERLKKEFKVPNEIPKEAYGRLFVPDKKKKN